MSTVLPSTRHGCTSCVLWYAQSIKRSSGLGHLCLSVRQSGAFPLQHRAVASLHTAVAAVLSLRDPCGPHKHALTSIFASAVTPGMRRAAAEADDDEDDEDEDFDAEANMASDSEDISDDADASGDAEMVEEEGEEGGQGGEGGGKRAGRPGLGASGHCRHGLRRWRGEGRSAGSR